MKIAAKLSMTALATVLIIGAGASQIAHGQAVGGTAQPVSGSVAVAPGPVTTTTPPVAQAAATPDTGASSSQVKEVLDSIKVPSTDAAKAQTKEKSASIKVEEESDEKDMPPASPKVPDSVKKVVKKLNDATEDVTLDSLNSAREAVVKLDVLIDIEKRLTDLTKIRKEREEKEAEVADAIPTSALPVPSMMASPIQPAGVPGQPASLIAPPPGSMGAPGAAGMMPMPIGQLEVVRVSGASGKYSAQIKDLDGQTKTVKVGDKLADGGTVDLISRDGVTFTSTDHKKKTVQVKDINTVFSGR